MTQEQTRNTHTHTHTHTHKIRHQFSSLNPQLLSLTGTQQKPPSFARVSRSS
jgi:hypothetical protein